MDNTFIIDSNIIITQKISKFIDILISYIQYSNITLREEEAEKRDEDFNIDGLSLYIEDNFKRFDPFTILASQLEEEKQSKALYYIIIKEYLSLRYNYSTFEEYLVSILIF